MKLIRVSTNDEGTRGILVFGDDFVHTLELPWRGNRPNLSCIPAGRYDVSVRTSPKYGDVYHVKNVPGRTYILLHHGNFGGDQTQGLRTHTAGCILLGSRVGRLYGQQAVLASRTARRKFETLMDFEPFDLEVIDGMA